MAKLHGKRKYLKQVKDRYLKSSLFGIKKRTGGSIKSNDERKIGTLLTPVRIVLLSEDTKRKSVLVLKKAQKGDVRATNMLISKSDRIASLITDTNLRLIELHNNGKIDLSGEAF